MKNALVTYKIYRDPFRFDEGLEGRTVVVVRIRLSRILVAAMKNTKVVIWIKRPPKMRCKPVLDVEAWLLAVIPAPEVMILGPFE